MDAKSSAERDYVHLLQEVIWPWGPTRAIFVQLDTPPPEELVADVNIVPRMGKDWALIKTKNSEWGIPGGTLEPGEDYMTAVHRELIEECGAIPLSWQVIGAWQCTSLADRPFRPHLPFPEYYRLVGVGEIEIIQAPGNPRHAEQIIRVLSMSLEAAMACFRSEGRNDLAELYLLAARISRQGSVIHKEE